MVQIDEKYREAAGSFSVSPEALERVRAAMAEAAADPEKARELKSEAAPRKWYRNPVWVRSGALAAACLALVLVIYGIPRLNPKSGSVAEDKAVSDEVVTTVMKAEENAYAQGTAGLDGEGQEETVQEKETIPETTVSAEMSEAKAEGLISQEEALKKLLAGEAEGPYDSSLLTEADVLEVQQVTEGNAVVYRFTCRANEALREAYADVPETVVFDVTALTENPET